LDNLENYSLRSSEEINEEIEGLTGCIASNSGALEKSLHDLIEIANKSEGIDAEEGAHKILA
jgi:hypothetical protein